MAAFKFIASFVVGSVGFFLILRGKKTQNTNMMILGGVLLVASYWVFS